MTAKTATIPVHILHSNVSMTAKLLWLESSLMSSKKRPDVIIEPKDLAKTLKRSVSTIRRALRELINAGLIRFKSWVCKKLKVFTLLWQAEPSVNQNTDDKKPQPITQTSPTKKPKTSSFIRNEKGELFFQADEIDQVREVAYKLVDIGFAKDTAIEIMNKRSLPVLKKLINEIFFLEQRGELTEDKVAWFRSKV